MPRRPLDPQTEGTTDRMYVRVPVRLREAAERALRDGETLSQFVREAMEMLVKQRKGK